MYKGLFIQSWKDLKDNPILFVPDVIVLFVNLILGFFFLKYSGILKLIMDPETLVKGIESAVPIIKLFLKENILRLIVTFVLSALTSFVIGSGLIAMKFGMMKDLINKKKLTIKKMFKSGKYVWQVISMKMIIFAIGIVTFLFLFGTGIILNTFLQKNLAISMVGFFFPVILLILQLLLFFRYPIIFLEEKHPFVAVKESFNYFLKNKKHVFIIWLIILAISFIPMPLNAILGLTEQKLVLSAVAVIVGYLIKSLINMIITVWSDMFKFRNYIKDLKP